MFKKSDATIEDVYNFWNENFLYSFELQEEPGSKEFFDAINRLKKDDIEKFSIESWEFDKHKGEKVLDIGCGPGWLVRNYAENGAEITAVDISNSAVDLTKKMLEIYQLKGNIIKANAEELPFENNTFDFISSSGVLHHTPDMQKAINEAYRVLKPGCRATISIYYKNILLTPTIFPIMLKVFNFLNPMIPGRNKMLNARDIDDFIRMYDGENNPVGYGSSLKDCKQLFSKFEILGTEIHFFPKRFFPLFCNCPDFLYKIFDRYFGTMIYMKLRKNKDD